MGLEAIGLLELLSELAPVDGNEVNELVLIPLMLLSILLLLVLLSLKLTIDELMLLMAALFSV